MTKALQLLVAVTCIVIIACGGWWLLDQRNQRREADRRAEIVKEVQDQAALTKCKAVVADWDAGNPRAAERVYGSGAEAGVEICRSIISIDEIKRSKLSE